MIGMIWAQSRDGIIGDGHSMPWYIPEDLKHFREITMGAPVIMGRKTWESLPASFRPLPGRDNYVLSSREPDAWSAGATVITSLPNQGWVIGGGEIYAAAISQADVLEVTLIDAHFSSSLGDAAVFAPAIPPEFTLVSESQWEQSQDYRYKFQRYVRSTQ